jgi:hypothetical protein
LQLHFSLRASLLSLSIVALALFAGAARSAAPAAAQPLETGIAGMGPKSPTAFAEVKATGSHYLRITVPWQDVAPSEEPNSWQPQDPGDSHYNWAFLDQEVKETVAEGLIPLMLVEGAPRWAQRCKAPAHLQYVEVCDPDPTALADFATAAAKRYDGSFDGLPRVRYWQGLNEPNLSLFFYPQFSSSGKPLAASLYRTLINSFYTAVKSVDPKDVVIAGGLGPIEAKGYTVGPLKFTRELLCMSGGAKPKPTKGCAGGVHFDVFDIHPYTTGGPTHRGGPNDVELGDMKRLQTLLKAADNAGHLKGSKKKTEIWVAEFSWDSKPPDPKGLPMKIETRWIAEALHVSWLAGVSNFFWYSLRDEPLGGKPPALTLQSGLFFLGANPSKDRPKEALGAFRFPFVAYPGTSGLGFWGRTPTSRAGKVTLETQEGSHWRKLAVTQANRYGIFKGKTRTNYGLDEVGAVRAVFGTEASPAFAMRPVPDFFVNPFG